MPNVAAVSSADTVISAIARASGRTQTDFDYMLAQARVESALDPAAKARTSSAAGLYQFTRQTWLETLRRHGAEHGYGWASEAIGLRGGKARLINSGMEQQVMDLRYDPQASALMAGALANDNAAYLYNVTGREPDAGELYLAHFLGASGAGRFLAALKNDPQQPAAALFPEAAGANRAIFYSGNGARSLGEVRELIETKLAAGGTTLPLRQGSAAPAAYASAAMPGAMRADASAPPPPMSAILASTFGTGDPVSGRASRHVAAAYARLSEAGL